MLGTSQNGVLLSRHGAVPVRVPDAKRFAAHKLLASQLRTNDSTKSLKALQRAAVVIGFLGEHHPGGIEEACEAFPTSARNRVKRAVAPLVDIKEAVGSEAPRQDDASMPRDNAKRVLEGARHLSPMLGNRMVAARLDGSAVVIRELMPEDLKLDAEGLTERVSECARDSSVSPE